MPVTELSRFAPRLDPPKDFGGFWRRSLEQLAEVPCRPVLVRERDPAPDLRFERVIFSSLGYARIHGYRLAWKSGPARPLVVHAHGYDAQYDVMLSWALRGYEVFGFDARGFGRSHGAAGRLATGGYLLTGIGSPVTSILRGAVADYLRAAEVARELSGERAGRVIYYGFSFGGALALMAAALARQLDLVVVGQPTFGWHDERRRVARAGSTAELNAYLAGHPGEAGVALESLRYFDILNFAPMVGAPGFLGVGLDDDVVPSRTVLAAASFLAGPVEIRVLPVSHSADPRESLWRTFEEEWLAVAGQELPPDFGHRADSLKPTSGS